MASRSIMIGPPARGLLGAGRFFSEPTALDRRVLPMGDRFLRACRREPVDRTPVWFMRQAGRYLPEYQEVRAGHSILEVCKTPALAVEVTLQPVRRFAVDAAIIFADILLPLEPMGLSVEFTAGEGPVIVNPVRSAADVTALRPVRPVVDLGLVLQSTCQAPA